MENFKDEVRAKAAETTNIKEFNFDHWRERKEDTTDKYLRQSISEALADKFVGLLAAK